MNQNGEAHPGTPVFELLAFQHSMPADWWPEGLDGENDGHLILEKLRSLARNLKHEDLEAAERELLEQAVSDAAAGPASLYYCDWSATWRGNSDPR